MNLKLIGKHFLQIKKMLTYYPQMFLMATVSTFEKEIKTKISNIISNPNPNISLPILHNTYGNTVYGGFVAKDNNGTQILSATKFYNYFGGQPFALKVNTTFNSIKSLQEQNYKDELQKLLPLLGQDDRCDMLYVESEEIYNRLFKLSFNNAENAFLQMKLKRNTVVHNFLNGISDSFEDIKNLYYDAVLYVVAVKMELQNLSII